MVLPSINNTYCGKNKKNTQEPLKADIYSNIVCMKGV